MGRKQRRGNPSRRVSFLFLTIFAILSVEFFRTFGMEAVDTENGRRYPFACRFTNLHRPWAPWWTFDAADRDDPNLF